MTVSVTTEPTPADPVLAAAIDVAWRAAVDVGGEDLVGDHLGARGEGERIVTHAFATRMPGYSGWYWAVTLARGPRARSASVDEVVMLPGADALLAPTWVPWEERVRPGDLGPGDLLPTDPDDPRVVPAYAAGDDQQERQVGFELGLGRKRVMSREGRLDAADRWYEGAGGPDTPMARQAPAHCGTCAFLLPLAGSLAAGFGVCGNEVTESDGRVVSVEFGCGAHSEAKIVIPPLAEPGVVVYDDGDEISVASTASAD